MTDRPFQLVSPFAPAGDQPQAIAQLVDGLKNGLAKQTLLGVTGSGKTFSMAHVIESLQRPTLILAHNKTLAAQLYGEMREFFPHNAVEYFVSYYDYYQPEAYVPSTDTYIEKDASINQHIEQMRLSATKALLERRDVVIVATVSAIYGLGDPAAYHRMVLHLARGTRIDQRDLLRRLAELQYTRNPLDLARGTYRVRGDVIDIFPAESERAAVRVELFDDSIEQISMFDPLTGEVEQTTPRVTIYPKTHYVTPRETLLASVDQIRVDLAKQLNALRDANKLVEAQRLEQRTRFDMEMIVEVGYCSGIENYSRYLSGRRPGEPPPCLFDYLPDGGLLFVDESHVTIPQIGGMYKGDRSRKETLVEYGFRLPSALDNRPLSFDEYEQIAPQTIFVSATPGPYEETHADQTVEQVVRPTGLVDPMVEIRPGRHAGGRRAVGDQRPRRARRARLDHDAHEAHGRGPHRLPPGARGACALSARRRRDGRAHGDRSRSQARRVRRARGHQLAARGARFARGFARRHLRRGQGRLLAVRRLVDPDDRPRGPQRARHGDPVRRPESRARCSARSTRPTAGAPSSSSSTRTMESSRRAFARPFRTSWKARGPRRAAELAASGRAGPAARRAAAVTSG